jgi:hypothetical protein
MPLLRAVDVVARFADATEATADGGSPLAATLRALRLRLAASSRPTYVVLVTDGGADCGRATACSLTRCIPNIESMAGCAPNSGPNCCDAEYGGSSDDCLDEDGAVAAVEDLRLAGVKTFVVGISASGPYEATLEAMAKAGGTASPFKLGDPALQDALAKISGTPLTSCTVPLPRAVLDPRLVDVYLDAERLPRVAWTVSGASLTLVTPACERAKSGAALDIRVVEQCPTPPLK